MLPAYAVLSGLAVFGWALTPVPNLAQSAPSIASPAVRSAENELRLDDPLSRFRLSVAIPNGDHITVRQVCQMRSGLFEAYDTPQFDRLAGEVPAGFNARQLVAPTICCSGR